MAERDHSTEPLLTKQSSNVSFGGGMDDLEHDINLSADMEYAEQILPWIYVIYFSNIALGFVFNTISLIALLRTKRNGTLSIICQIIGLDIVSAGICIVEIVTLRYKSWIFGNALCPLYTGAELLIHLATLYLIICLNYHTISLCNIKIAEVEATNSCGASNECLVRESIASIGFVEAERRLRKDISVLYPSILIWGMCISLSIPQFTLVSTSESFSHEETSGDEVISCSLMDRYFATMLINVLTVFRVLIPFVLMAISWIVLLWKLVNNLRNDSIPSIFTKKCHNVVYYLIFCLALNLNYVCTSFQRLILYAIYAYNSDNQVADIVKVYLFPPLYNFYDSSWINLSLYLLHYSGTFLRFLIYVCLLPKFKSILFNNFFTCFKRNAN